MKKNYFLLIITAIAISILLIGCQSKQTENSDASQDHLEVNLDSNKNESNAEQTENPDASQDHLDVNLDNDKNASNINDYHPILLAFKDKNDSFSKGIVLGGFKDKKWFAPKDFNIPIDFFKEAYFDIDLVKGGETYKFYTKEKYITSREGEKPTLRISESSGSVILKVKFEPFHADDNLLIGVNGDWSALPRVLELTSDNNSYSIDLEGDEKLETISCEKIKIKQENYNGQEYLLDGVKLTLNKNDQKILIDEITVDGEYTSNYEILTLDLNNDNKLEVLIYTKGHNYGVIVYEFDGVKFNKVVYFYDGD